MSKKLANTPFSAAVLLSVKQILNIFDTWATALQAFSIHESLS